jgi:hypothetical protein
MLGGKEQPEKNPAERAGRELGERFRLAGKWGREPRWRRSSSELWREKGEGELWRLKGEGELWPVEGESRGRGRGFSVAVAVAVLAKLVRSYSTPYGIRVHVYLRTQRGRSGTLLSADTSHHQSGFAVVTDPGTETRGDEGGRSPPMLMIFL